MRLYTELSKVEAEDVIEKVMFYRNQGSARFSGMRASQNDMMALVENRWPSVFTDEMDMHERQLVANTFRVHTEDLGNLFAETVPMQRVFEAGAGKESAAEKREQVLSFITENSREWNRLNVRGMDMAAGAYTVIKVWPDFGKPVAERFPRFRRLHPLNVWPETNWHPDEPSDNVVCEYVDTWARLEREFPDQAKQIMELLKDQVAPKKYNYSIPEMVEATQQVPSLSMIDYYSVDCAARVALCATPTAGEVAHLLEYREHETGICPVQIAYRPTWASIPTGLLDDAKGPMQAKNQAWNLIMGYFIDMLYGGKLAWNVANPKERGPGTVYQALGPDAKLDPVTAQNPGFAALQVLTQIDSEGRDSAVAPRSRQGDVELNKATAAYLGKAQGQLSSVVKALQSSYAQAKQIANVAAFAQDERWCNAKGKRIFGFARGKRFQTTYTPDEDLKGDYANIVNYGPASGLDTATHMVLMTNKRSQGAMSLESFLEQDPTVEDVTLELSRILKEGLQGAVVGSALPNLPPQVQLEAFLMAKRGDTDQEVLEYLVTAGAAAQQQAATLAQGLAPAEGAPGGSPPPGIRPGAPPGVPGAEQPVVLPPRELLRAAPARR